MIPIYLTSVNNIKFMKIFALKLVMLDGDKPESFNFLVKAETYGRAEAMGYEIANEFGWQTFSLESVVKKQIKEVHTSVNGECSMWLVAYEFGLEAKPEKSNILIAGKYIHEVTEKATKFLGEFCDSLFIKEVKYQDFQEFIDDSESKDFDMLLNEAMDKVDDALEFNKKVKELKDDMKKIGASVEFIHNPEDRLRTFGKLGSSEIEEDFEL
jgi:hypothetical protein